MFEPIFFVSFNAALIALSIGVLLTSVSVWWSHPFGAPALATLGLAMAGMAIWGLMFWVIPIRDITLGTPWGTPAFLLLSLGSLAIVHLSGSSLPRIAGAILHLVLIGVTVAAALTAFQRESLAAVGPMATQWGLGIALATAVLLTITSRSELFLFGAAFDKGAAPRAVVRREPAQRNEGPVTSRAPSDVFISYKRDERARVEQIAQTLRDLHLSVWFDARLQSGKSFDDEINREVRGAKAVLVCWSRGAVDSEWVRAEASIGRQRGVLAACFLEACDPYPPFNLVHAEDLSLGSLDASNPNWVKIVDQIGRFVGRPGLGEYLQINGDRGRAGVWLAENASDPLADTVLMRMRS